MADIQATWPFIGRLISFDGQAVAIGLPIESKSMSLRITNEVRAILDAQLLDGQTYHVAGLPIAEDQFGYEMFVQMAYMAPLAFCVIMVIIFVMFRRGLFLIPPGLDAMASVIVTMGLLIFTGNKVHIMSSMIPIFLMPTALLDDIHVIGEFFDRYRVLGNKRKALLQAMESLYVPMLQTSLTTAVGFLSLAVTNIPPVQVFGIFVGFGTMVAWFLSMTVVPAVLILISDKKLAGLMPLEHKPSHIVDRLLLAFGSFAIHRTKIAVLLVVAALVFGALGIGNIVVNDNPVKWFEESHPLRVADRIMNSRFGGTYDAYVIVEGSREGHMTDSDVLKYMDGLAAHLVEADAVGTATSVADAVKVAHLRMHDNDPAYRVIPDDQHAIAQYFFAIEGARPTELLCCVDIHHRSGVIGLQMVDGDNQAMKSVAEHMDAYDAEYPLPEGITLRWSGLTHINRVWQEKMVTGMAYALAIAFVAVLLLMIVQFKSLIVGVLAVIPLAVSLVLAYGLVGWVGKNYDMPIAVCSTLALGLGIDFAIHYIARWRVVLSISGEVAATAAQVSLQPGRTIIRSCVIIGLGFLPLTLSSLGPYVTVGVFFAMLMAFSTVTTRGLARAAEETGRTPRGRSRRGDQGDPGRDSRR